MGLLTFPSMGAMPRGGERDRPLRGGGQAALPRRHAHLLADRDPQPLRSVFLSAYEAKAADFAGLLATPGVGAKGLRALALLVELLDGVLGRAVRRAKLGERDELRALRRLAQTGPSLTTQPQKRQLGRG